LQVQSATALIAISLALQLTRKPYKSGDVGSIETGGLFAILLTLCALEVFQVLLGFLGVL
jgi:hypothetical protein